MIQSLPRQSVEKGKRVREPHGVQKLAAFSERSRGIAEQQQRRSKGAGCQMCVLSLAEVAERSGAGERNREFKVLARSLELAEIGSGSAEYGMSPPDHRRSLRRFGEGKYLLSQLSRHTVPAP